MNTFEILDARKKPKLEEYANSVLSVLLAEKKDEKPLKSTDNSQDSYKAGTRQRNYNCLVISKTREWILTHQQELKKAGWSRSALDWLGYSGQLDDAQDIRINQELIIFTQAGIKNTLTPNGNYFNYRVAPYKTREAWRWTEKNGRKVCQRNYQARNLAMGNADKTNGKSDKVLTRF
jgi:hypothetical protein